MILSIILACCLNFSFFLFSCFEWKTICNMNTMWYANIFKWSPLNVPIIYKYCILRYIHSLLQIQSGLVTGSKDFVFQVLALRPIFRELLSGRVWHFLKMGSSTSAKTQKIKSLVLVMDPDWIMQRYPGNTYICLHSWHYLLIV